MVCKFELTDVPNRRRQQAYILRDGFSGHNASPGGYRPRKTKDDRRVHPQRLVQAGQHVSKPIYRGERNIVLRLEGATDLLRNPLQRLGVLEQQVGDPTKEGRRRLRPSYDDDAGHGFEIFERHALRSNQFRPVESIGPRMPPHLISLQLDEAVDEVRAVNLDRQSLLQEEGYVVELLLPRPQAKPYYQLDDPVPAQASERLHHLRADQDGPGDQGDPGVVIGAVQTPEGRPHGEVSDDVERRPGVPIDQIGRLSALGRLPQALDEEAHITANYDSRGQLLPCTESDGEKEENRHKTLVFVLRDFPQEAAEGLDACILRGSCSRMRPSLKDGAIVRRHSACVSSLALRMFLGMRSEAL